METDLEYYERRATEEQKAAFVAKSSHARRAHTEMAARYVDLATSLRNCTSIAA
ncbi:MAG: hypothetical protein ACXWUN_02145 [Allosphingosinicella sp.]